MGVGRNLRKRLAELQERHLQIRTAEISTHTQLTLLVGVGVLANVLFLWFFQVKIIAILLILLVEIYVLVPALLYLSTPLRNSIVFMTWAGPQRNRLRRPLLPEQEGVRGLCRHRFLATPEGHRLGLWECLSALHPPRTSPDEEDETEWRRRWRAEAEPPNKPVFLLLHGQGRHRGGKTRTGQVNMLTSLGFNTLSFDYRGFGDSSGRPTPEGVVNDTIYVYLHLKDLAHPHPIILYGHSLGSGIATRAADCLKEMGERVSGLVLDAAFSTFTAALRRHHLFAPYRLWPSLVTRAFERSDCGFPSNEHVARLRCPILILHARDDPLIPFSLAEALHWAALDGAGPDGVELILFDASLKLGHNGVHTAAQLPDIFRNYLARSGWHGEALLPLHPLPSKQVTHDDLTQKYDESC